MECKACKREIPDNSAFCNWCGKPQETAPKKGHRVRGNGMGTVFKRGKTWSAQVTRYYQIDNTGPEPRKLRKTRTKGGFSTKKAALEYIETLNTAQHKKVPTLLELYNIWAETELPKLATSKQQGYRKARERLEPIIGRRIDSLTTGELQELVNAQASSYYTARDMKTVLSHCYKRALADQFVTVNLSQYIVLPELDEQESVPFSADEVDIMWKAFADGELFVGYMLLMIYSGMMPGELFACKKDMIDYERCEIWGCGKKTKKRKKEVPIVFAECVKPVLIELSESVDGDTLQPMEKSLWYDTYHQTTKKIGVRDLPPYSCRHTTGTEAARKNLNASLIQKIMRHSRITTSQKYIHLGAEDTHSGINTIAPKNK